MIDDMGTPKKDDDKPLSPRERLFVLEYLKDMVGAWAARRAGFSYANASAHARYLLSRPRVQRAIADAQAARLQRLHLDADEILREILAVGTFDLLAIYNDDGSLKPVTEMSAEARKAICSIETIEGPDGTVTRKVTLWNRLRAQELLARHLSLLNDRLLITGELAERIIAARQRTGT